MLLPNAVGNLQKGERYVATPNPLSSVLTKIQVCKHGFHCRIIPPDLHPPFRDP